MIKALTREYLANYPYIRDVIAKDEKKLQKMLSELLKKE